MKLDIKDKVCYATTKEYGEVSLLIYDRLNGVAWVLVDISDDGEEKMEIKMIKLSDIINIEFV